MLSWLQASPVRALLANFSHAVFSCEHGGTGVGDQRDGLDIAGRILPGRTGNTPNQGGMYEIYIARWQWRCSCVQVSTAYILVPVMSPGAPVCRIYDGPAEMMACSSPCLDRMCFFRSGESKKTKRLLGFKDRCSVRFSVNHVVGFSVINVCS